MEVREKNICFLLLKENISSYASAYISTWETEGVGKHIS